jgi:hypothetical protein
MSVWNYALKKKPPQAKAAGAACRNAVAKIIVAADVRRLFQTRKSEPRYLGCYDIGAVVQSAQPAAVLVLVY